MRNSKTVLIDKNPGRNSQTFGIARELGTDVDLIHEPSVGVVGNKGDSQCYIGVSSKVEKIHEILKNRIVVYKKDTLPVLEYYKNLNKLYSVDGMQNVEGVSKDIQNILTWL